MPQGLTVVTIPAPKAYPNGSRLAQLATKTSIMFLFIPSSWVIISHAEMEQELLNTLRRELTGVRRGSD